MSHTALLGGVEIPTTFSKDEAIGLMQEQGLVGAGGAGFPTHIKWMSPVNALVVNCAESEPGYYADKLLLREEPEAYVNLFEWLRPAFSLDAIILAAEEVAKPYLGELERLAQRLQDFSIAYVEPKYKFGQEKALCQAIMGIRFGQKELPLQYGLLVNNNETLFNMYRAIFRQRPVITKFLQVYGDIGPPKVFEAPIGTLAADLLRIYGVDTRDYARCRLYDGGPVLADLVADPMGREPLYPVQKATNGLLVVHAHRDRPRRKYFPTRDYDHNTADAPYAAGEILRIDDQIGRVRIPLKGRFWKAGRVMVRKGDHVERKDDVALPVPGERSVGVHASISGTVKRITPEFVEIAA